MQAAGFEFRDPDCPSCPADPTWAAAYEYANWLSRRDGLDECYQCRLSSRCLSVDWDTSCGGYRVPTSAEWERAARAGSDSSYGFGEPWTSIGAFHRSVWGASNPAFRTWTHGLRVSDGPVPPEVQRVGILCPNRWGLYDMLGNRAEYVWDSEIWVTQQEEGQSFVDPVGQGTRSATDPVVRGGNFYRQPHQAFVCALGQSSTAGFRLVRTATPEEMAERDGRPGP